MGSTKTLDFLFLLVSNIKYTEDALPIQFDAHSICNKREYTNIIYDTNRIIVLKKLMIRLVNIFVTFNSSTTQGKTHGVVNCSVRFSVQLVSSAGVILLFYLTA